MRPASHKRNSKWQGRIESLESRHLLSVTITELMANNASTFVDESGETYDWLELHNQADTAVDLQGWSLTDNPERLNKWQFPSVELAPGEFLIVYASGRDVKDSGSLHVNFKLDADGEYLALVDANGEIAKQYAPAFPRQYRDVSYGHDPAEQVDAYFSLPTPGRHNVSSPLTIVQDVESSHPSGIYDESFLVQLTSSTDNAIIRYTIDGNPPTLTSGVQFQAPLRIERSTVSRAAAFWAGTRSLHVSTLSYLFVDDAIGQSQLGAVQAGYPSTWGDRTADYEMDPRITGRDGHDRFSGKYAESLRDDLLALPTLSVVAGRDDLFDAESGIYSNPQGRGERWERSASVTLIDPSGSEPGFQADTGLRIQGGITRFRSTKHGLRLAFRDEYGPSELNYPLYGDDAPSRFNSIVLRPSSGEPDRQIIRDANLRQTQLDMGQPSPHGRFVHLYLNELYWGLYEMVERPDEVFAANYFDGDPDEWDVINAGDLNDEADTAIAGTTDAWNRLIQVADEIWKAETEAERTEAYYRLQGRGAHGSSDPDHEVLLDVDNYIDYLIFQWYLKNTDWPTRNFYMARRRGPESMGFRFIAWDGDFTVGSQGPTLFVGPDRFGRGDMLGPSQIFPGLYRSELFRERFRQRIHHHIQPGGALYVDPEKPVYDPLHPDRHRPAHRYDNLRRDIHDAVVAESARWGDAPMLGAAAGSLMTRDEIWQPRVERVLFDFFSRRHAEFLQAMEAADLYDPDWEPPPFLNDLLISELNYHPSPPTDAERAQLPDVIDEDFEYIELFNRSDQSVSLLDFAFTDGIAFVFGQSVLPPNSTAVVVADRDAFRLRYGDAAEILGQFQSRRLSNAGERIELVDSIGRSIVSFHYDDGGRWPQQPDGDGMTLELIDPFRVAPAGLNDPQAWRSSLATGGSPGDPIFVIGDANEDGIFNSSDLVVVFAAGLFETRRSAAWHEGDWNGDGVFDSSDLVFVMVFGRFEMS